MAVNVSALAMVLLCAAGPVEKLKRELAFVRETCWPRFLEHGRELGSFGSRQTGTDGCSRAADHIASAVEELGLRVERFSYPVLVALEEEGSLEVGGKLFRAHPLLPNCVQPSNTPPGGLKGRLVYAGRGTLEELARIELEGSIVVMEFNSGDAWLRACEYGAEAVLFLEPEFTNTRQADAKYLATVPVHMPRAWVPKPEAEALRSVATRGDTSGTLNLRTVLRTVDAPCIEARAPGNRPEEVVLCARFDAASIAPGLSPGGDEVWGAAAAIELARLFKAHPHNIGLRVLFFSGNEQSLRTSREYVADRIVKRPPELTGLRASEGYLASIEKGEIGRHVLASFAVDFSSEEEGLAVGNHGYFSRPGWDFNHRDNWLAQKLFPRKGEWYDELCAAGGRRYYLYGNQRPIPFSPVTSISSNEYMQPFVWAPKFYQPSEPWGQVGSLAYELQTSSMERHLAFTPLDTFERSWVGRQNLLPQLEAAAGVLSRVLDLEPEDFTYKGRVAKVRYSSGGGGYAEMAGKVGVYDIEKVWYDYASPGHDRGARTYVLAYPTFVRADGGRAAPSAYPGVLPYAMAPWIWHSTRLQSFMVKELVETKEDGSFLIRLIHQESGSTCYNLFAFTVEADGRISHGPDFGLHGNIAFPCLNRSVTAWRTFVHLTLHPCGVLELFDLVDARRYAFNAPVQQEGYRQWGWPSHARMTQDFGRGSSLPIFEIREAETRTDAESYGWIQYGHTACAFLPEDEPCLLLLGKEGRKFQALGEFSPGEEEPEGIALSRGERKRLLRSPERYYRELQNLTRTRMENYGALGVRSPQAEKEDKLAEEMLEGAESGVSGWPQFMRAWDAEARAYDAAQKLKFDVVKTTVFYFILLIPFSFLFERLIFPQTTALRTFAVSGVIFAVFALMLWYFHPGFTLAENIFITIISFIIVLLTIPALFLVLYRGIVMLKEIAGRYAETHQAKEERAGMVLSALSLSISNMRRRKLRTSLTLGTITLLVLSLVLFTSFTAGKQVYRRPEAAGKGAYEGVVVYNTYHHVHALIRETALLLRETYTREATVVFREYLNYGYQDLVPAKLALRKSGTKVMPPGTFEAVEGAEGTGVLTDELGVTVPTLQVVSPEELKVTRPERALVRGRWFEEDDLFACIISGEVSRALEADVGERVELCGLELEVAGVFDSRRMDSVVDLNGDPFTPIFFQTSQEVVDRPNHQPSASVLFLPERLQRELDFLPTAIWAVVIVPDDPSRVKDIASEIATTVENVDVYECSGGEVTVTSAYASVSVAGAGFLVGPLVITFFMILNIMLGTVYERTKEINIFSSVGLSPKDVAGMFLTESVVYAGIAAVMGYFLGVVLLHIFQRAGWLPPDFYPNYLGMVVIYATGLAVAATVSSSLYPMWIAARIVNPSLERTWTISTKPEAGEWEVSFPFIAIGRPETLGIVQFMREFVEHNTGEAKGVFTAEPGIELLVCEDGEWRKAPPDELETTETMGLGFRAWLAPFERNVRQDVIFCARHVEGKRRWHFSFILKHLTGPEYLWVKSNRYFLDQFRKQMLLWRTFSDELIAQFAREAKKAAHA